VEEFEEKKALPFFYGASEIKKRTVIKCYKTFFFLPVKMLNKLAKPNMASNAGTNLYREHLSECT
jgi:hypothetical protein